MWNFDFVYPSMAVLFILLVYFFFRPMLPNRMNRAFLNLIFADIATVLLDLASSMADENHTILPLPLVSVLNLLYFMAFLFRVLCFFHLTLALLKTDTRWSPLKKLFSCSVFLLSELTVLSSPLTGAVYTIDSLGYHRGPLYDILPVCSFFYLFLGICLLIRHRKQLRRGALVSAFAYHLILAAGNGARILFPQYLVMNFFCLLAILVIFLSFENPDLYITDRGPAFNTRAFTDWLDDPMHRRGSRVLGFAIRNYNDERSMYGGSQMDKGLRLIISFLVKQFPEFLLFYLRGGNFALTGPENADWNAVRSIISGRFQLPWQAESADMNLSVTYVEMGLTEQDMPSDGIISTLLYALDEAGSSTDTEQVLMPKEALKEIGRQIEIKRCLDRALDHDSLEVFLQPIYSGTTRAIHAAEALARLRDDDGRLIAPGMFIPLAEKNGRINRLGEQVLRKVCIFIKTHDIRAMGLHWINVNLSPLQCMQSSLPGSFSDILSEYGVPADLIHLEITEESMINYMKQARQMEKLLQCGFHLALDDYGSGFSNLHQVMEYPFSSIKLDMSIVWDYIRNRDPLLPALVRAFRQMGFTVTAEGIENREMEEAMAAIGCDYLQGYCYSVPLSMEAFAEKYSFSGDPQADSFHPQQESHTSGTI